MMADMFPNTFSFHPAGFKKMSEFLCSRLAPRPPGEQTINLDAQPSLSFIPRAGHSDMMSLLYNTCLFHLVSLVDSALHPAGNGPIVLGRGSGLGQTTSSLPHWRRW